MKKLLQKLFSGILALTMCFGMLSMTSSAADDAVFVINSDQIISNESIDGDVYILQDTTLTTTDETTITGDVYIFGTLNNTGTLTVSGTLYCLNYESIMTAGDYDYGYFINSGNTKITSLHVKDDYLNISISNREESDSSFQSSQDSSEERSDDEDSNDEGINDQDSNVGNSGGESSNEDSEPVVTEIKKVNGTWTYLVNGVPDYTYTGFGSNSNGKWYVENGKVTFKKNSVIKDKTGAIGTKGTWYYVVGSKVQTDYTGVADYKNSSGWWYIKKGKVDFSANTVAKNKNGWWYVKEGKVNFKYNGFASNSKGNWYIENGKVTFKRNSVIKDKIGSIGKKGTWWYVVGSKVQTSFTGLANYKNSHGWWYINKGKVTFDKNTVAKNKNGWYYVKDSKVDFSYTGIAKNKNGWWYIKKGKVDFSAGDYSFAEKTSQIIDVKASGSKGTLTLYNKSGNKFTKKLSTSCYVGENGIASPSKKKEGDKKTPKGVYTLGQAFGIASDPGCTRNYLKLNSNYYWVNDSTSKYYNQLVDITKTGLAWKSAEHLINYTTAYKYAIAIDYNTKCTPNKGSAYFLHCSRGKPTAGCVAVSEKNMIKILQSLKSDTRIYIH